MREVVIGEDYFKGLKRIECKVNSEGFIYYDEALVHKLFYKKTPKEILKRKEQKIEIISQMSDIDKFVKFYDRLFTVKRKRMMFQGYTMDYVPNSKTLFDMGKFLDMYRYFDLLKAISLYVKRVHNMDGNIVFADLSFFNILIDEFLDFHFIDLDNIMVGDLDCEFISSLSDDFYNFKKVSLDVDDNFDRLTMFIYFINYLFDDDIFNISMYDFDKMSENVQC